MNEYQMQISHQTIKKRFFARTRPLVFFILILSLIFSLFLGLFSACQQSGKLQISPFLLDLKGKVHKKFHSSKRKQGKKNKFSQLGRLQKLPLRATIKSDKLSSAHIQFNHFLSLRLDENTILTYRVQKLDWNTRWKYQLDINIKQGGIFVQFNGLGDSDKILILFNDYFWSQEPGSFHLNHIVERKRNQDTTKVSKKHWYTALSVARGGVHYISPLTGQVDMYISQGQKFVIKNNIPQEIQYLSSEEKKFWLKKNQQKIFSQREINKKIYLFRGNEYKALWYWFAIVFVILVIIGSASYILIKKQTQHRRHTFQGVLTYWQFDSSFITKKNIHWSKRRGRRKIYIGKKGFCHVKIKEWQGKRRAVIEAHLDQDQEYYTIRYTQNQIVFLRRKDLRRLSPGDEFIIHSYQFKFTMGKKKT